MTDAKDPVTRWLILFAPPVAFIIQLVTYFFPNPYVSAVSWVCLFFAWFASRDIYLKYRDLENKKTRQDDQSHRANSTY